MTEPRTEKGLIALPAVGARVVVRYLLETGQATDALGPLLSVDDHTVVVQGVRGIERIAVGDIVAAKEVPPRPEPQRSPGQQRGHALTLRPSPTQGIAMHADHEQSPHESIPGAHQPDVPEIEEDQTVAPRPEEEIADIARSEPDPHGHGGQTA